MTQDKVSATVVVDLSKLESLSEKPRKQINYNIFEFVFLTWLSPILRLGYKKPLTSEDLFELNRVDQSKTVAFVLEPYWARVSEYLRNPKKAPRPSFVGLAIKHFFLEWLASIIMQFASTACLLLTPIFLQNILSYLLAKDDAARSALLVQDGFALAFILFILQLGGAIAKTTSQQLSRNIGVRLKTMLTGAIFDKSLRLTGASQQQFSQGQILNMVNVDTEQIAFFMITGNELWSIPIQIGVSIYLLYSYLGDAVWAGVGSLFVVLLIQLVFTILFTKFEKDMLTASDKRLKVLREVLYAMKVIKFRAWEHFFEERVDVIRQKQIRALKRFNISIIFFISLSQITPVLMPIVSFVVYSSFYGTLSPVIVFPSLTLFTGLFGPLIELPQLLTNIVLMLVSWKRITAFLVAAETDPVENLLTAPSTGTNSSAETKAAIEITGGEFKWPVPKPESAKEKARREKAERKTRDARQGQTGQSATATSDEETGSEHDDTAKEKKTQEKTSFLSFGANKKQKKEDEENAARAAAAAIPLLRDVNLSIQPGTLTAIVGSVGSGKSSLLSAIIGEMSKEKGSVKIFGRMAYCAQQPWTLTDSLRGNILFGNAYDEEKMNTALDICALRRDIAEFPAGELTEIGEKGINLSGGQKARVALARAVFDDADTYLLDDVISALDAHVGAQVFQDCIVDYLVRKRGKTVLLVTHQLQYLRACDRVIVMDNGRIVEDGTLDELMAAGESYDIKSDELAKDGAIGKSKGVLVEMMKNYTVGQQRRRKSKQNLKESATVEDAAGESTDEDEMDQVDGKKEDNKTGGIIQDEERETGAVRWAVYVAYARAAGGWPMIVLLLVVAMLWQGSAIAGSLWLSYWTSDTFGFTTFYNLTVYSGLGGAQAILVLVLNALIMVISVYASIYFHRAALTRLMKAPMSFFDGNPIGRIMNRFSKDIVALDQRIIFIFFLFIIGFFGLVGSIVIICFASPIMLAVIVPLFVIYYFILNFYRNTLRELKRLDSNNRSPLYAHISETLAGVMTVRAYGAEKRFIEKQRNLMDFSNEPFYHRLCCQAWISLRIAALASVIAFALALIGVYTGGSGPSFIGLGLAYAVSITEQIGFLLESTALLESEMNSVERLVYYSDSLPEEKPARLETDPKEKEWPTRGAISFVNLELRYESRLETPVIKDFSGDILPGERVALVGRTGSGKSSLVTALFRIIEPYAGTILIDGKDIMELGLHTLRSRMQIIPQEPVLFEGTIRSNLDLEQEYTDAQIWEVLDRVGLKAYVSEQDRKLEAPLIEGGENLSVGQRQLMCLARSILRQPRILIMDEATASVDTKADQLIQDSIQKHFKNTTVIAIAHRLNTVAAFDRIMVLDNGQLIEFDTPHALLQNKASLFTNLVEATGTENAAVLRQIAGQKEQKRLEQKGLEVADGA